MRLLFPRARPPEKRKLPFQCPRASARRAQSQVIRTRSSRIQSRQAHGLRAISVSKVLFVATANSARRRLGFGPSKTCLPFFRRVCRRGTQRRNDFRGVWEGSRSQNHFQALSVSRSTPSACSRGTLGNSTRGRSFSCS